ncbi:hypothetical protein [Colwellia psychrerythraea]|uniref:Lipoprotein n=1 Tax=Colwellia psychrerythraea TaxID=28229 RepID=A0A099K9Q9_COLPS|nr:hypothetical protein [Colwellia psychrerythraea]KGJ86802.1 hypothetical protein GAB14E_4629 [Colwellia psychrerythraea]
MTKAQYSHRKILTKLTVLFLLLSMAGCSVVSGRYGPFTFTVQTQSGAKVDDIIVGLSFNRPNSLFRSNHTYREKLLVNSGEKVTLPRGYVLDTEDTGIGMILSVQHMDYYQYSTEYVTINTADKNVIIVLPDPIIKKNKGVTEKEIKNGMKWGAKSRLEAIHRQQIARLHSISQRYFVALVKLGREDLVEKYLTLKMTAIFGDKMNSSEAKAVEQQVREGIRVRT